MFKSFLVTSAFLFSLVASFAAQAQSLTVEQKLSDLNQLFSMVESGYGPLRFKSTKLKLNVSDLRLKYEPLVRATTTNGDFYYLMKKLVAEFQDGHFGISIPSDHEASLPITTDLVDGKVLIDTVDLAQLPNPSPDQPQGQLNPIPLQRGDEVISINGVDIQDVLDDLQAYVGSGYGPSARRSVAQALFVRRAASLPVPTGKARIEVRRGTSKVIEVLKLDWIEKGTALDEKTSVPQRFNARMRLLNPSLDLLSMHSMLESVYGPERLERSFRCSGGTRITIPSDATVIMKEPFVAYYHPTAKGNVGYLRIPHYYWIDADGTLKFDERYAQYQYAISLLEKNTVGLVIDQDHNCGGSVSFLESMVGLFMDQPFQPLQFQLLASKQTYVELKAGIASAVPHTSESAFWDQLLKLVLTNWQDGKFMTPKTAISGYELVQPSPVRYSKPVVMLIDELSGSGGDAFPAMMKGFGRATLIGTRTSGLGGHVNEQPSLFYSQMQIRMTKSLFYRPDGVPVENNGAVPDVPYVITRDDFMYGYKGYQEFYLNVLLNKIDSTPLEKVETPLAAKYGR